MIYWDCRKEYGLKAVLTSEAIKAITDIVNNGNKAVVQRMGTGVIVMSEKRKIQYSDTLPDGKK